MGIQWATPPEGGAPCLLLAAGSIRAAIPIAAVIETMRPLPLSTLLSGRLAGVAIVRSAATIVADLSALLGEPRGEADRWVSVRAPRPLALAARVIGVRAIDRRRIALGQALCSGMTAPFVDAIVEHEGAALAILDVARILDDEGGEDERAHG